MNKRVIVGVLIFIVVLLGGGIWLISKPQPADPKKDAFAQCLASKNVTMYGAYYCSHCQNQKNLFGSSFKYIPYVECTVETKKCSDANVRGYPTWIFSNGKQLEGEQSFSSLAQTSGCPAP